MGGLQIGLETVLIALLGATVIQALRLSRDMGNIKRDRGSLEAMIKDFNDCTRQAEAGVDRLRIAADGAGRTMARQIEGATNLRDELTDLIERGERLSHRLSVVVRAELEPAAPPPRRTTTDLNRNDPVLPQRSQAERDLLRALRVTR